MEMSGEQTIAASKQKVWAALNDVEVLKQCVPGCESLEKKSDTDLVANIALKLGPIKAVFACKMLLTDLSPPDGYTIVGEGKGGAVGYAKGAAKVRLVETAPGITTLRYETKVDVGGKVAQLGARLLDSTAKALTAQFFEKFGAIVGPSEQGQEPAKRRGFFAWLFGWLFRRRSTASA